MKRGASLIEVLAYIACSSTVLTCSTYVFWNVRTATYRCIHRLDTTISLTLALTLIFNEIKQAPSSKDSYKKRTQNAIIYSLNNKDYGWCIEKGRLMQIVGIYNTQLNNWSTRSTSIILKNVKGLMITWHERSYERLSGVTVTLVLHNDQKIFQESCFIALRTI